MAFNYNKNNYGYGKTTTSYGAGGNQIRGIEVPEPNEDTITQLEFARSGEPLLVATGWDATIRVWQFDDWNYKSAKAKIKYKDNYNNCILRSTFDSDCEVIYYGTSAGEIKKIDLNIAPSTTTTTTLGTTTNAFGSTTNAFGSGTSAFGSYAQKPGQGASAFTQKPATGFGTTGTGGTFGTTSFGTFGGFGGNPAITDIKAGLPPPTQYICSGLKWCDEHSLLVAAVMTNGTTERPFSHSFLIGIDPRTNAVPLTEPLSGIKVIDMDCSDEIVYIAAIEEGTPRIGTFDFRNFRNTNQNVHPENSGLTSMPTSIAAMPVGFKGYICSTIQGFVELKVDDNKMCDPVFRTETQNKCCTTASNCVAVCPMDKRMAMAAGGNEIAFFNLDNAKYVTQIPQTSKKDPITACAFSPSGEVFACAQGYDWSQGADYMSKNQVKPLIFVGSTPNPPKSE